MQEMAQSAPDGPEDSRPPDVWPSVSLALSAIQRMAASPSSDDPRRLEQLVEHLRAVSGADLCLVLLREKRGQDFRSVASSAERPPTFPLEALKDFLQEVPGTGPVSLPSQFRPYRTAMVTQLPSDDLASAMVGALWHQANGPRPVDSQLFHMLALPTVLALERSRVYDLQRQAAARVEELERLRSDFLLTLAHELRTPLTMIRTATGLLAEAEPDQEMRSRILRGMRQSVDRMHALLTDLLDLARLRSGHLELQPRYLDVGALVRGAVALVRPLFEARQQTLRLSVPRPAPHLVGDSRRLDQVLVNLLSNANKFTPQGGRVQVSVQATEHDVIIAVSDTGPGIPPEDQPHLFDLFWVGGRRSGRRHVGSGIGLPIAKGIVEAHGGQIWAESEPGHGATFFVRLPRTGLLAQEKDL